MAALQFLLQHAGQGAGRAHGLFGPLTRAAVMRAQGKRPASCADGPGRLGHDQFAAVRGGRGGRKEGPPGRCGSCDQSRARSGDPFGAPRHGYTHAGIKSPTGRRPIAAAGVGTVIYAAYNGGGYGNLVVIQHRLGYTSWYGHMSTITAYAGEEVAGGTRIGYVGATGDATGPHLHFEVRHYDTPINPVPLLLARVAGRAATTGRRGPPGGCDGASPRREAAHRGNWIAAERLCAER